MARKQHLFQFTLPTILKNFLLGLCCTLLILFSQGFNALVLAVSKQHQAQQLTQLGHTQLDQGQAQAALQTWEAAYQIYLQLNNSEGSSGTLINQSLALQALGLYPHACQTLLKALKLEDWICTSPIQQVASSGQEQQLTHALSLQPIRLVRVIGLQNLGNVLRLIGKPNASETVLQKAVDMAKSFSSLSYLQNQLLLSLANTERTLYNQAKSKYQMTDEPIVKQKSLQIAQSKFKMALELEQKVTTLQQSSTSLQAQLNQLSLLLEPNIFGANTLISQRLQSTSRQLIQTRVKQLLAANFGQLPAIESLYARLNFIQSLMHISQDVELNQIIFPNKKDASYIALTLAESALQLSQKLDNERAESYALGILGKIYSHLGQVLKSKQYLEKALSLAQSVQAWDIAYQWQQQLGRMYQLSLNYDAALEAYAGAISSLNQVQGSILSVNPDIQFSFKDKIEPVYIEYIELLLAQSQPKLNQVIQTYEQLKLAELENFLQCGKLPIISLSNIQTSTDLPPTVYLMNLGKRVEVIVRTKSGLLYRHTLTRELVNDSVENLLRILQDERFAEIKPAQFIGYLQTLYQEIFAPIKKYLPDAGTLVFVPDSYFQNLPIAMLHDGKNYLISDYNISIALSSKLVSPKALTHEQLRVLIAGISQPSPSLGDPSVPKNLSPLPEVAKEVAFVKANTVSTVELLNAEFTSDRFRQRIELNLPVTHITTHGQFSSDPEQTFILAWDKAINVRQLNFLLRGQDEHEAIELLVLSACQTAKGDRRSVLGIAGVAAQAGARSTLASLWLVDALSTAQLMGEFYSRLKNGVSKAEALRQAQLTLLSNPKYSHPFYWGTFVLVGSWL